jgi:uncharacterized protein (DUF1778 family)
MPRRRTERKPKDERKEEMIRVRVTKDQLAAMTAAAHRSGLELSSWLRSLGMQHAGAL